MIITNKGLAQVVAQRLNDRVMEDLTDLVAELTMDVLSENGIDPCDDGDFAWETMMDVSSRIYIGSN